MCLMIRLKRGTCLVHYACVEDVFKGAIFVVQGAANQFSDSTLLLPVQLWTIAIATVS